MKYIFLIVIFVFAAAAIHAQKTTSNYAAAFSKQWKADSLGKLSFRSGSLKYHPVTKEILSVNGINLLNFTRKQIAVLLGEPNRITNRSKEFTFAYFLAPHCGFAESGCPKWVLEISFKNDKVQKFYSSFIELDPENTKQ